MAAILGESVILKQGSPLVVVASVRNVSIKVNNEEIDITTRDSSGFMERVRGKKSTLEISATALATDSATLESVRAVSDPAHATGIDDFECEDGTGNAWSGQMHVADFEIGGDYASEAEYTITLRNAGSFTYGAAS